MTQEEKKLLYKDLSARQPYRPFICFAGKFTMPFLDVIASTKSNELISINGLDPEYVKPYLRPMSSMTDEERMKIAALSKFNGLTKSADFAECSSIVVDYCYSRHLDIHGLIEKGLALVAPEDMYKTE